jgi:hypothetical protein
MELLGTWHKKYGISMWTCTKPWAEVHEAAVKTEKATQHHKAPVKRQWPPGGQQVNGSSRKIRSEAHRVMLNDLDDTLTMATIKHMQHKRCRV